MKFLPGLLKENLRQVVLRVYQAYLFRLGLKHSSDIIVMLVPEQGLISGGILSIYSFYYATKALLKNNSVFICTPPNRLTSLRYRWFKNEVDLISFDIMLKSKYPFKSLMLHIPEYYVPSFVNELSEIQKLKMKNMNSLHINVMNQNDEYMPSISDFNKLKELTSDVTITTAHISYTTKALRNSYHSSVHLLSAWFEQNEVSYKPYNERKDIMIISPDLHPAKENILAILKEKLPHIEQIIIKDMLYEDYKYLESVAKWSISFGEGFDGYTIFPALKGGISFAVFNRIFFTDAYSDVKTFYSSYEVLESNIVADIIKLDDESVYNSYNEFVRNKLEKDYSYELYMNKVKEYYKKDYTLPIEDM